MVEALFSLSLSVFDLTEVDLFGGEICGGLDVHKQKEANDQEEDHEECDQEAGESGREEVVLNTIGY